MTNDPHSFFRDRILGAAPSKEDYRRFTELLWEACSRDVFLFARARLTNHEDARDVCQDTFLRAIEWLAENPDQVPASVNFPAWLRRIARNLIIDRFRRPALVRELPDLAQGEGENERRLDDWPEPLTCDPSDRITEQERLDALRKCLDALSERKRQVIVLRDLNGLSYDTIASRTAIPRSTVGVTLHRVRRELRDCIELRLAR
ncbi:MAG: RNA polymerase sigma factor [Sedimentisphaerales bacterium]|nr:RNA polymerase sigma factor [Sedimentisphaerales bacterium]